MSYFLKEKKTLNELVSLEDEWNQLLERSEIKSPFLTFEFISNYWRFIEEKNPESQLLILTVRENGELLGIAPLMKGTSRVSFFNLRKIEFIGAPQADIADFIIPEKNKKRILKEIYSHLLKKSNSWDSIALEEIPEDSSTLSLSPEILRNSSFGIYFSNFSPSLGYNDLPEEELKKKINKKSVRREIKKIKKKGKFSFDCLSDYEEAKKFLPLFFQLHIKRWGKTPTKSMFEREEYRRFYEELFKSFSERGYARLFKISFNEEPIAFEYGLKFDGMYFGHLVTYDREYRDLAPGIVLLGLVTKEGYGENWRELKYGRGKEGYKLRFVNKIKKNYKIALYGNSLFHLFDRLYQPFRYRIIQDQGLLRMSINLKHTLSRRFL